MNEIDEQKFRELIMNEIDPMQREKLQQMYREESNEVFRNEKEKERAISTRAKLQAPNVRYTNKGFSKQDYFDDSISKYNKSHSNDYAEEISEPPETMWKNPRPKTPNKKVIQEGDLVLVHNHPIMLEVLEVQKEKDIDTSEIMIKLDLNGEQLILPSTEIYPQYKQSADVVKVGNIVYIKDKTNPYIVGGLDGTQFMTTNNLNFGIEEVSEVFGKVKKKESCSKFSCGSILFNGDEYKSLKDLKAANTGISFNQDKKEFSLEHFNISTHFNISANDIKPKENNIGDKLREALDHPLNVEAKEWALLVGPSGSGKTEMAISYANKKKQTYIKLQGNGQVSVDDLIGYKSITDGTYFPSLLREAVENGHLFILDEIDACNSNTLLTLNGLKQEYFQFPDKLVKIHENFRLVATANTLEYSEEYNSRSPMDKATKARFDIIEYDMKGHELAIRYGFNYVKRIENIDRLTPREVSRLVTKMRINEEAA